MRAGKVHNASFSTTNRPLARTTEARYRRELASFGKMLHARGYVSGCDGNLSVRLDTERFLTTPTGMSKAFLEPEHMVVIDNEGRKLKGGLQPSSEIGMHLAIYRSRPKVGAVVHAHPLVATAFACAGMDLTEPVCSELVLTLGSIPLAPYAPPGSSCLGESLRPFIHDHEAILMQNHGVVAYGQTLMEAYLHMETVEHCACVSAVIKLLGQKTTLNAAQAIDLLQRRRMRYGGEISAVSA